MLVPAVVVRLTRPPTRESLDGFMIGALGALTFTAAATLTRLAPQFTTGMIARSRPMSWLIVEAGIRGYRGPVDRGGGRRPYGCGAVVHPAAEQGAPAPGYVRAALGGSPQPSSGCTPYWGWST